MKNKRLIRKVVYYLLGVILLLSITGWIFFTYFFQDFINEHINAKLKEATRTSSHGLFRLEVGKVRYADGSFYCTRIELLRARYDSTESGLTMKCLTADSVSFQGLHILELLLGKGLFMEKMTASSPQVFLVDAELGREELRKEGQDTTPISNSMPPGMPVISYENIDLSNINIHIPQEFTRPGIDTLYAGISIRLKTLRMDDSVLHAQPALFCKGIDLNMRNFPFDIADSSYQVSVIGMHALLQDSLITIDSFNFHSKYSENVFAAAHRFATPMISVYSSGIRFEGIDMNQSLYRGGIRLRKILISSFDIDSYEDRLHPANPHPKNVLFPNEVLQAFPGSISIDSIIFKTGRIRLRERWRGGTGVLGFDKVHISVSPIEKDSTNDRTTKQTNISIDALFLGETLFSAKLRYFLGRKQFDMDAHATLGSFNALKLNPWLVPVERMKVESGIFQNGTIDMSVRDGKATTKVLPLYRDFVLQLLPADPHEKRGLIDKIKTFAMKTFIIRKSNPNGLGSTIIGLTQYDRIRTEEFFQYLWFAVRKSLLKVVG